MWAPPAGHLGQGKAAGLYGRDVVRGKVASWAPSGCLAPPQPRGALVSGRGAARRAGNNKLILGG